MTEKMIRDAYCKIRTIDQTIPDDVLDFMKDASIEKLKQVNNNIVLDDVSGFVCPLCKSNHNTDYGSDLRECQNCGKHFKGK